MKIPEIKKLVDTYSVEQLMTAEEALVNEESLPIEIGGTDEGEQLTHVFAAIYVINKMHDDGVDFKTALRDYTSKVRNSIN